MKGSGGDDQAARVVARSGAAVGFDDLGEGQGCDLRGEGAGLMQGEGPGDGLRGFLDDAGAAAVGAAVRAQRGAEKRAEASGDEAEAAAGGEVVSGGGPGQGAGDIEDDIPGAGRQGAGIIGGLVGAEVSGEGMVARAGDRRDARAEVLKKPL